MDGSGFFNVMKPPGMTSHDVVAYLRKRLNLKKIGHGGTLDPLASGVLVCLANDATRLSSRVSACEKVYNAQALFGVSTDSGDLDGAVLNEENVELAKEDIEKTLDRFRGEIEQTPPMVSALKVGGERLYDLARRGVSVERESRKVIIRRLDLIWFTPGEGRPRAAFEVRCSGGTYIRTLIEDIGRALGAPATTAFLTRSAVGPFRVCDSVAPQTLADAPEPGEFLIPPAFLESA